jgi:adenylosuccinate synthase
MASTAEMACDDLERGKTGILEVPQGFEIVVNHGFPYLNCTSRECSPMQGLSNNGIPSKHVRDIYAVIRTYPIRISNETTKVEQRAGAPLGAFSLNEFTTVTKKLRRVFELDIGRVKRAVKLTGVNKLALNFIQYINYEDAGVTQFDKLSEKSKQFIQMIECETGVPVVLVGTGARNDQVIDRSL